jgi:hypothetical protein
MQRMLKKSTARWVHLQGVPARGRRELRPRGIEYDIDDPDSLQAVPAFQAFVSDIADRCDIRPVAMGATIVGGYR